MENSFRRSTMIPYHSAASRVFLRITWRVWFFNFSIISLKDSNGENQKKRATNTAPFLLFYVSICRRIRKIIVLSLLSRLLEILQLFLRQFNFPTIPHQTLTDNNERFVLNCLIRSLKWKKVLMYLCKLLTIPLYRIKRLQ